MEILTSENIVQREQHEPDSKLSMVYLYVTLRNRVTLNDRSSPEAKFRITVWTYKAQSKRKRLKNA